MNPLCITKKRPPHERRSRRKSGWAIINVVVHRIHRHPAYEPWELAQCPAGQRLAVGVDLRIDALCDGHSGHCGEPLGRDSVSTKPVTPASVKRSGRWSRVTAWMMLISYLFNITVAWAGPVYPGVDIPISTGVSASSCSLSGTPGNGFGPVINSHSNTFECKTTNGQTVAKSSTPTAHDITQFAKGFLKGLIEGIWQQITGLWGLLFNIGPLIQLAHDLATHPQQTLATIEQVLHKQFTSLTQIRQEIVCEPYSGGQLNGVLLITVASMAADGEGVVADLGKISGDLEHIAKSTATDTLKVEVVNASNEAKAVSQEFASGQTVVVEVSKDTGNVGFGDLAKIRKELGLPPAGSAADKNTLAVTEVDGQKIYGINAHGQPVSGVNAISATHAEIDVLNQIKKEGIDVTGQNLTLYVDRAPCAACGQNGGIRSMVKQLGLNQLTVISPDGSMVITPR